MNAKKVEDYVVMETTDYSLFKKLEGNRAVKATKKIKDSIREIGVIDNPIIVNEKFEVCDGQNRLEALKELNLPVLFHVVKGIGIEEARYLNMNQTNWKTIDYVRSYAETGNESYQELIEFYEQVDLDISVLMMISDRVVRSGGGGMSNKANPLVKGEFVMTPERRKNLKTFATFYPAVKSTISSVAMGDKRLMRTAIGFCATANGVDHKRLEKVFNAHCFEIIPYPDALRFLAQFSDMYNKGLRSNRMYFESDYRMQGGK